MVQVARPWYRKHEHPAPDAGKPIDAIRRKAAIPQNTTARSLHWGVLVRVSESTHAYLRGVCERLAERSVDDQSAEPPTRASMGHVLGIALREYARNHKLEPREART